MPVLNSLDEFKATATEWRRHLHQYPELDFDVQNTAAFVEAKLLEFGVDEIETGIAKTGVVAIIKGRLGDGPIIGLRADMDALPIKETTGKEYSSKIAGKMHACGHDGHTVMLLGAAKHLAETRNYKGSVALIFQPAEEGAGGGHAMVEDGFMDRFNISEVYGMHNMPGIEVGSFGICEGPIMAALDEFDVIVTGKGGHAGLPHLAVDPIIISAQILLAIQTLVSRGTDPLQSLVITATKIHAGDAYNIIPMKVEIAGTVRTLIPALRDFAEKRIYEVAASIAAGYGASVEFKYRRHDPVTFNSSGGTQRALRAARSVVGAKRVDPSFRPLMASEDFAFMLEARPGAFIFLGNGPTAALHHPAYDFNDEALPYGISYWVTLVETTLTA
ncbi:amidohydrolase [Sinorhizobium medicae]|uniref:M20 aminoacylase family protein n=1 Tax=Sinorhizobium medicae TaxID=110321 RepID=UPI001294DE31|nr:M20 aminoacylase family protein [Sinorhizobium medicae]MQX98686.1 amidohydrolase [Sinorhizobium medicae]